MPRNPKPRPNRHEKALEDAIAERKTLGTSYRDLANKYNVPKSTIERHINSNIGNRGRKPVFDVKETADLVETIVTFADIGFGMTSKDIGELVCSYVDYNDHVRGKKAFNFKGRKGYPGPDWLENFVKANNLSAKQATTLSTARYNATKNPFVINHFYDLLEDTIKKLKIEDKPHLIWNCDESGLPHEPSKLKIISRKGQKTLLVNPGADRENTTVMAAVSATGQKLPPMIVFEGVHVQTTWRPNLPKDHENYPWLYANKSGWMDSSTFYRWFEEWESKTRTYDEDGNLEPRLLIYDGHLSHIWYGTIELARKQKCFDYQTTSPYNRLASTT
ncbi:uncharacterized protein [Clytia hemisphaerica]|uniref:uncharacterized protein n=1 Tax=Clytia hemisphaerica TaxID=252671 RepID=UPI0034D6EA38